MISEGNVDVILLNLPVDSGTKPGNIIREHYVPTMGLMFLSLSLELNGYSSLILDLAAQPLAEQSLIDIINCKQPILLGISAYTANFNAVLNIYKR